MSRVNAPNDCRGILRLGMDRLAHTHPYHAEVLARWVPVADGSVGTAAVGLRDYRLILYYDPAFIAGLPLDELAAVLAHVTNHVILGHVCADPEDYPDGRARVVAQE